MLLFFKERKEISIVKLLGEGELEPSPCNTLRVPSISYWVVLILESVFSGAVALALWFSAWLSDQQHQHHLGTC